MHLQFGFGALVYQALKKKTTRKQIQEQTSSAKSSELRDGRRCGFCVPQSDNLHGAKQPDLALKDQGQRNEIVARFLLITALPRSLVEACILRRRFPLKY